MKSIYLILINTLCFASFALASEVREFDSSSIKRLEVSNAKGEIQILGTSSKKIVVSIEKIQFDKQCKFIQNLNMATLTIKVEQENAIFEKANCISKLKIEVPTNKSLDIDVSTSSADIALVDTLGSIIFRTATGAVNIKSDILKNIEGKTATGDMQMSFKKCPARADIDIVTAAGHTEIFMPAHCKIKVGHKSATGELFNELGESQDYQIKILSKSATGNLSIKKISK
ncbi:MAG: DUF4097 family beta strand repeat-containing protein [Bacteriovorax sp.]